MLQLTETMLTHGSIFYTHQLIAVWTPLTLTLKLWSFGETLEHNFLYRTLVATLLVPIFSPCNDANNPAADWKQRHAGVMGISFVGREFTAENSLETVKKLVPLLDDRVSFPFFFLW